MGVVQIWVASTLDPCGSIPLRALTKVGVRLQDLKANLGSSSEG